jgi:hypothetical protein
MSRQVARPGVDWYQVPLGTILTPQLIAAAKARHGGKSAPRGSSAPARLASRTVTARPPTGYVRQTPPAAAVALSAGAEMDPSFRPASVRPAPHVQTKECTLAGTKSVMVAGISYGVPPSARVALMRNDLGGVYIIDNGNLHVLIRVRGQVREVDLSIEMQEEIIRKLIDSYEFLT